MPVWPAYAAIVLDDFGLEDEPAIQRTDVENGPAKQTRVKSRVMVTVSASVFLRSRADYNAFIAWHRNDVRRGADWFDWTHPVTGAVIQARIAGGKLGKRVPLNIALSMWRIPVTLEYWDA